jgi:hypothetical protein
VGRAEPLLSSRCMYAGCTDVQSAILSRTGRGLNIPGPQSAPSLSGRRAELVVRLVLSELTTSRIRLRRIVVARRAAASLSGVTGFRVRVGGPHPGLSVWRRCARSAS